MTEVTNTAKKAVKGTMMLSIYAVYFIIPDMAYISPALNNIAIACNVDAGTASYMMTLPSLTQIISAFLCGYLAGRYVNYKTLLILGVGGVAIFGTMPVIMSADTPFWLFLVLRACFGFCLGFLMPVMNTTIAKLFSDEGKRSAAMGKCNVVFNIGAIVGVLGGGALASMAWNGSFWMYGISAIVFIFVCIWFKEPDHAAEMEAKEKGEKAKIPAIGWFFIAMFTIVNMVDQPVMSILANVFAQYGIGDAGTASLAQAVFLLMGIVIAACFAPIFKKLNKWVLAVSALCVGVGQLALFAGTHIAPALIVCVIAIAFIGGGSAGITIGTPMVASTVVTPAAYAAAMAFSKVGMDIGAFLSSPYVQLVTMVMNTTDYSWIYLVDAILALICMVLLFIVVGKAREVKEPVESE